MIIKLIVDEEFRCSIPQLANDVIQLRPHRQLAVTLILL